MTVFVELCLGLLNIVLVSSSSSSSLPFWSPSPVCVHSWQQKVVTGLAAHKTRNSSRSPHPYCTVVKTAVLSAVQCRIECSAMFSAVQCSIVCTVQCNGVHCGVMRCIVVWWIPVQWNVCFLPGDIQNILCSRNMASSDIKAFGINSKKNKNIHVP